MDLRSCFWVLESVALPWLVTSSWGSCCFWCSESSTVETASWWSWFSWCSSSSETWWTLTTWWFSLAWLRCFWPWFSGTGSASWVFQTCHSWEPWWPWRLWVFKKPVCWSEPCWRRTNSMFLSSSLWKTGSEEFEVCWAKGLLEWQCSGLTSWTRSFEPKGDFNFDQWRSVLIKLFWGIRQTARTSSEMEFSSSSRSQLKTVSF